ncbi:hypothetical protein O9K51_09458 [Purpureocillium lavendulum]|uniref:non-specific serine/threonine protein kinase n=1 Tax=Purpureocillium lavendulum TaxID=1247861 RepID=A0AB34FHA8_9HYPO|nr:hypothetical protein O9K51_09458 [Purpureocillium lavendulum]
MERETTDGIQELLREAQLRAEAAERRFEEERRQREAAEQQREAAEQQREAAEQQQRRERQQREAAEQQREAAEQQREAAEQQREEAEQAQRHERQQREAAEQQTQPTTLHEYLDACHRSVFTKLRVEHNPDLLSRGSLTNPQSKRCPTSLRQWPEFLEQQRRIFGILLDTFPCDSDRLFESEHFLATMGARIGGRSIADEKVLEFFLHNAVEDPVRNIVNQLVNIPDVRQAFDLGDGIVFVNHPHALSETAEEVIDRQPRTVPPSTPGHGESLKKLQADQICIYRSDDAQGERTRAFICEYKPPHKLTAQHLHVGLRVTDIYKEVVNRKTIPTSEDPVARFAYHAERLTASAITQTYHYMIEGGLEYSLLTTGEAIVFLKIDWDEPETLCYHLAVPSVEVAAQTKDAHLCTAVAQYLAFTLLAIDGLGTRSHGQDERNRVTAKLNKWEVSFDLTYRSIPAEDRSFLSDSSPGYQPPTYGNVDRSPIRPRKNPRRGQGHTDPGIPPSRRDDGSESSDEEPNPRAPVTPTPLQRNTRQGTRRSERLAMRPRGGGADNTRQRRQFCTQKCLLGLVRGHTLDRRCPNITLHCRGKTHRGGKALRHPVDHAEWLRLLRAQLEETLDRGITPLGQSGARGVLFKVTLLAYGYTFVSKGTIQAFIPDLEHEAAVYRRLDDLQGVHVPVFLGAIDLRSMSRTYFFDHRVYIVHLTFMAWAGESLYEAQGVVHTTEEQVKGSLRAIHQHGVIHDDVRAENILLCRETNGVMMIDFERAVLLEPPRLPLARMAPNKRLMQDAPGERKRRKSGRVTKRFSEDIVMASGLFVASLEPALDYYTPTRLRQAEKRVKIFHASATPQLPRESASVLLQQEVLEFVFEHLAAFHAPKVRDYLKDGDPDSDLYAARFREDTWAGVLKIVHWHTRCVTTDAGLSAVREKLHSKLQSSVFRSAFAAWLSEKCGGEPDREEMQSGDGARGSRDPHAEDDGSTVIMATAAAAKQANRESATFTLFTSVSDAFILTFIPLKLLQIRPSSLRNRLQR